MQVAQVAQVKVRGFVLAFSYPDRPVARTGEGAIRTLPESSLLQVQAADIVVVAEAAHVVGTVVKAETVE